MRAQALLCVKGREETGLLFNPMKEQACCILQGRKKKGLMRVQGPKENMCYRARTGPLCALGHVCNTMRGQPRLPGISCVPGCKGTAHGYKTVRNWPVFLTGLWRWEAPIHTPMRGKPAWIP